MKFQLPWAGGPDAESGLELREFDAKFRGAWVWEQPERLRARWRLTCGGAPIATLSTFGVFVAPDSARFADSAWEMRYRFPSETVVTRVGATEPCARYRPGFFGGGTLSRTGESTLLWQRDSFWGRSWSFTTSDHLPLVRLRSHHAFLRRGATVELEDAARRMADLPALLALGWVLVLRAHRGHGGHY